MFLKPISFLLSIGALTIVSSAMSASAETPLTNASSVNSEPTVSVPALEPAVTPASTIAPLVTEPTFTQIPATVEPTEGQQAYESPINGYLADSQTLHPEVPEAMGNSQYTLSDSPNSLGATNPLPGTLATSADALAASPETSVSEVYSDETNPNVANPTVAQTEIDPGRTTRGGASYIGLGVNLGIDGDTALGRTSFVVNSKIGLTRNLSFRPAALVGDDTVILVPVTYDFVIRQADPFEPVRFAPFLGGGLAFSTDEENNIGFLLTGGVDVPLSDLFVANAALNVGFLEDSTELGIVLGVGYTFRGF